MSDIDTNSIMKAAQARLDQTVGLLSRFAAIESPTDDPAAVAGMQEAFGAELLARGFRIRMVGRQSRLAGPHLLAVPAGRRSGRPTQLVLGHADTVWSHGTLESMPVRVVEGRLHGPGTFDMKAGITSFLMAIDVIAELGLDLPADPILFINADEETGSATSKQHVARVSRCASRAWVLEPPYGSEGKLKTARKGMVKIHIVAHGRAAHAGLDPTAGASAIAEIARIVPLLHAMQDLDRGVSVNVGLISGGTRPNVVAARAELTADARVLSMADAAGLIAQVEALEPAIEGVRFEIDAHVAVPPFEATPRNRRLWATAKVAARRVGLEVDEVTVGGASDGNTASRYTATLDGLGFVGDGAHAAHEHVVIDRMPERIALLVALLTAPLDDLGGPVNEVHPNTTGAP